MALTLANRLEKTFSKFNSLYELVTFFKTENKCKKFLADLRWGDDVVCPKCGKHHCKMSKNGRYHCTKCNHNFSCMVGYVFDNTKIGLLKWFMAMYMITCQSKSVSSYQLAKNLGITHKSAWYIKAKIMSLFECETTLRGEVQCDELHIGGIEGNKHNNQKTKNNQGRSNKTKSALFGMVSNDGNVVLKVVEDCSAKSLMPQIDKYVELGSTIYTDGWKPYMSIDDNKFEHIVVNHSGINGEGFGKTNFIESIWSEFNRVIYGTFYKVSKEHLQMYANEFMLRFNMRKELLGARVVYTLSRCEGVTRRNDVRLCRIAKENRLREMGFAEDKIKSMLSYTTYKRA